MQISSIKSSHDKFLEKIIKSNLKKFNLDIPGTAYFDPELSKLSDYYKQTSKRQYFVCSDNKGLVLGGAGIAEYDEDNNIAELQKLYLSDEAKGKGISRELMDIVLRFAKEAGYKKVYLETHHDLTAAVHLYKKYEFTELEKPLKECKHNSMDMFFVKNI